MKTTKEQMKQAINPLCDEQLGIGPCHVCERERMMRDKPKLEQRESQREKFLARFDRPWPKFGQDWR